MEHTEMHLNLFYNIHAVLAVHHINGKSTSAKTAGTANAVKVCVIVSIPVQINWEFEVHHQRHLFHINTCNPCKQNIKC